MASGDLTASTPTITANPAATKVAIDALNLATTTDFLAVIPIGVTGGAMVFKVERAA